MIERGDLESDPGKFASRTHKVFADETCSCAIPASPLRPDSFVLGLDTPLADCAFRMERWSRGSSMGRSSCQALDLVSSSDLSLRVEV